MSLLAVILTACGGAGETDDAAALEASFAAFAESLYRELDREPLGDTLDVEIGLFGDLNVMAGENVVMGRYRYRVDSTGANPSGQLSFLVRAAGETRAVPVVMFFGRTNDTWSLREATYVPTRSDEATAFQVEEALADGLEPWTRNAVRRASAR